MRENAVFSFSYFSSKRYGSNRKSYYGFDGKNSPKNPSYRDPSDRGSPGRVSITDKMTAGVSTKATGQPDAGLDPWNNGDRNALIGMKNINVQRGWEVRSAGRSNSGSMSTSYPTERPAQFETKKIRGDDFV